MTPRRYTVSAHIDANKLARDQCPSIALLPIVEAYRRTDEGPLDTMLRLLVYEALATTQSQRAAAKKLGISSRKLNYYVRQCVHTKLI